MELEEGDVVLCTVDRIVGTTVFVKVHVDGKEVEGSIVTSEIAAGRIRNLRDYVVPKKKIVCKVLRISGNRIDLSLRRVTQKEQKEVMERYNLEKSYMSIMKTILKGRAEETAGRINETGSLYNFFEDAKEDASGAEKLFGKENAKKIMEIINSQKEKNFIVKREIMLRTSAPNGIGMIKQVLGNIKGIETKYISAGRYLMKSESSDIKEADTKLKNAIAKIEDDAKKEGMEFGAIESKQK